MKQLVLTLAFIISAAVVYGINVDQNLKQYSKTYLKTNRNSVLSNDNKVNKHELNLKTTTTDYSRLDLKLVIKGRKYYAPFGVWLNQSSAVEYCENIGMQLLSVETEKERLAMEKYFYRHLGTVHAWFFFTSGHYDEDAGKFVWLPSNITIPLNKFDYISNKMNSTCVVTWRDRFNHLTWMDNNCDGFTTFMCEQNE